MAETFLFEFAGNILGKLALLSLDQFGSIWGVENELNRLEFTLSAVKGLLYDAADQHQLKSQQVKDWLEKLDDVLSDMDDILDDFMTEDLRRKVEIGESRSKEVRNFFSSSNPVAFRVKMSRKIKKLRERLEDIAADRRNYQFMERVMDTTKAAERSREQSHSFVRASDVIGRDHDKEKIVELLLSSGSLQDNNVSVLPIVGLGGLGKTTLVKFVYNDIRMVQNFEQRFWVCVSDDFDLKKLLEKIITAYTGVNMSHLDLDQMQNSLQSQLKSKKFLLVLDDVWNEDPKKWIDMRDLLNCGARGSTIVVTTRIRKIAAIMGTFPPYYLKGLSNDECLSIFLTCAFKDRQGLEYPKLVEIGKDIVNKCGGVPLAVRTLGSLLYTTVDEREWISVKDNDMWKIAQKENDILPILRLSYDQMPIHLKQCFAFCSIYPKGSQILKDGLINRWIAHGLVQSSDGCRQLEEIGNQCINELISRSFFQDAGLVFGDEVWELKMHDLMHDLAQSMAVQETSIVNFRTKVISEKVRHILFSERNLCEKEFPKLLLKAKKMRSFSLAFKVGPVSQDFLDALINTSKCLRLLDLGGSEFEELPNSIGTLKHLRFLSLTGNRCIKLLPESLCNLLNLQSLNLYGCEKLQKLPRKFGKWRSLRWLTLTSELPCLPDKGLEGLSSLRCLFIYECYFLESLPNEMQHLTALRALHIYKCHCLTSLPESMKNLTSLVRLWIMDCEKLNLLEGQAMEGLRSLQTLALKGLPILRELPHGLQHSSASLRNVYLADCPSLERLPDWLENSTSLSKLSVLNCSLLESHSKTRSL